MFHLRQAKKHSIFFLWHKIFVTILRAIYGFQIEIECEIGEGFYIGHFGTIIVNGNVKFGKNCNISPGVVIGQTNRGEKAGSPKLGDEVWIGFNSVLVGNITIGSNVLIAPNSFVNVDVPNDTIVIGNPAKKIPNTSATYKYINNKV